MKRGKPPLTIHTKGTKTINLSISRASSESKSVKFENSVFTQKEDMSEECEEMDVIRNEDLILNSFNSSRFAEGHSSFLTENENSTSQFDDSTSQQNLGREWGEDILRSFAALDHENIEKFVKVNDNLTRYKDSIRCTRSSTFSSNQLALVPTSIRKTKKPYRIISIIQQRRKSMVGILASKKVKIACKRLRTTGKNWSLRFLKHKHNIRTNYRNETVNLERSIKNRNSCSISKSKQNVGEVEEYSGDEEKSGHLFSDSEMKLYQYQRRRGNAESLENCEATNHIISGLAHSFVTEACDTKSHSRDANQCCTKNNQETNYIFGDTKSKSPVKLLPTDGIIITPENVKRNYSNNILIFSIDKNRVSPVGGRSKFSHSQKLLRQSKLFLIKRSARFDQEPPSHTTFSVNRELLPNVENECLKRRREGSPSPTQNMGTTRETELDPLATTITPEVDENPSNVSIAEANTKKEKLGKRQRKLSTKSSLQDSVDVDDFFENHKSILRSFPKVDRMKKCGEICSELQQPSNVPSQPRAAGLSPLSRHSASDTSPKIRHNSPFEKAKRSRPQFLKKSLRKCHENASDDCNVYGDKSSDSSSGIIRKAEVNSAYKEIENVCLSNPGVTACSEDKHKKPSSCKTERTGRYFLRKKEKAKKESEKFSSTSQAEKPEIESNVQTSQVHEMENDAYSGRSDNREIFGSEIAESDFSMKKFPQIASPPNDSRLQKECKNTVISKSFEEKKKKNTRRRKLWSQSSSLEDIPAEVVNKTSCSSRSHEDTCRSRVNNQFENARNNFCTLQVVNPKKKGSVVKKCSLQHVSNSSQKEVGDCTLTPIIGNKIRLLPQQQDAKETRCIASEEASTSKTSIKIQELHVKQNNADEKDNNQGKVISFQQYSSERNNYSSSPRFCSEKEAVEECISKEKGNLKETHNHSPTEEEDNKTSYSDETITVPATPFQIQKGNEKQVLNLNGLPNIEQLTPTNIVSTVDISPNLLRSISVRPKIMSKSPSLAPLTVKTKNDLSKPKASVVEENTSPNTQENLKNCQDTSIQFSEGGQIDSEVKDNLQKEIKNNDELTMKIVHPVNKNSKNNVNKEKLLISPTNVDVVRDARRSPLKENSQESHDQLQKTAAPSSDNHVDTDSYCVPVFPRRSTRSKTLIARQPSAICSTNFKIVSEISMIKASLNTRSDCEFLNGTGEKGELLDLNVGCATNTDCTEPIISPSLEKQVYSGSFTVKNAQEVNNSLTDLVQNSLTGSNAEKLSILETKHDSEKNEKNEDTVLITPSRTISHLSAESKNKYEDQFNYNSDPAHSSRSSVSESEGNRASDSRKSEELYDVAICRLNVAESCSETSLHDSTKDKTNTTHKLPLILSESMSMPTHNNSVPECITGDNIHNALCHSNIDSENKNISRSEMMSIYLELLENWKRELKVKRRLIFQQNSPGVATCETKTTSTSNLNMGNTQDDAFEVSRIPVCEQHKEDAVDSFIRILTKKGTNSCVIMCFPLEEDEKQTKEEIWEDLQERTSDISGKEKLAKKLSTSPCRVIFSGGENNEKLVKIQNGENAFSETSKVLREEIQNISHQTFPVIKTQGTAASLSGFTNKCKESLKLSGKRTNNNEPNTIKLKREASKDKVERIARFFSCPNKKNATQQQNYSACAVITADPDILNPNTELSDFSRTAFGHTVETVNCSEEEKSHCLKENQRRTGNYWEVEIAAPVAVLHEDVCTIPAKGKSESTSWERQSEELASSNCVRRNTYLQNESRTSATKAVKNKKVIRKTLRSPYMLRNAKRDANCLSLQSRKKRQLNSEPLVNQSVSLRNQDKSLQMFSHPSFLLSELTRIVRSPYLLRNRKIKSQFSFLKHSKQMRTVRKVNSHSVSKPIVKSGSNNYGPKDNNRKIRSPYMLRNDERSKPCKSSNTNKKRKIRVDNIRKSASLCPISREQQRHFVSTVLPTVARISRSPYLHRLERKRFQAKKRIHIRRKREEVVRASHGKIQDVVGSQVASGAKVQTNAADINPCISKSKEGEREIVEEDKSSTTRTYSDLDFHVVSGSSEHKTSRSSSEVQKYQRTSLSEHAKENLRSSRLPPHMNTMLSKGEETLSKSYPLQPGSHDTNPRFPIFTESQSENGVNDLNDLDSVKSTCPKISIQPVQISSKASALAKHLPQTSLVCEMPSEMILSEFPILVDRNISEEAEDHPTSHVGREESFLSTTKEDTTSNTDMYYSSLDSCNENGEISEADNCFELVKEVNQSPPNWDETPLSSNLQEETPLSSKLQSPSINYTFSKEEENNTQHLCSPFLQQYPAGKRVDPCLSITAAQKRELVNKDLHSTTSAHPNTGLHSKQGSSGSNILEKNNARSSVHRRGRNKIGFEGSCWLNDDIRKLFPLPQCLDESRNRIMSSSTFIWLCSEKKSRESRFPLFKKRERTKSKKTPGKKQRDSTLNTKDVGECQLVSDGGRKKMKPQMNHKKCDEKKENCSWKYLANQRNNRMSVRKFVATNEKTNAFRTRQELQKRGENANTESRSAVNKKISFKSQERLSSSEGKPLSSVPDTRKKSQTMLDPPVVKGVMTHIISCRQSSQLDSIIPTCQNETLEKKQLCIQSTPVKVKSLKISKNCQKVEPEIMHHSRRQHTLSNKREDSENFPQVFLKSAECVKKRKPKSARMSGTHNLGGYIRSTSSKIAKVTDSNLSVGNNANEGGKSDTRSLKWEETDAEHSENYENTKIHKREEMECTASTTDGYLDVVKFLEHMHSISLSAAKIKSKEHVSSSFILTRLINDSELQANCCELNNETSMADKLTPMIPAKKSLTRKSNDRTIPMDNGNESENLYVQHEFTLPVDHRKATVTKKHKRKSKQERNAPQGSNFKGCTARKEINRRLGKRESSSTSEDGKTLSSLTSKDTRKRKQRTASRKLWNQESFLENSGDTNATQIRPATFPQASLKASLSANDAKYGSQPSNEVSPQETDGPSWSPLACLASRPLTWRVRGARRFRERRQDQALDLFSPDKCAIYRAVQRAKRQLVARAPPPAAARTRARSRVDEVARRLWGRE